MIHVIAQAPPGGTSASAIFYLTLLFIFLTAIVTTLVTKWSRDKCLKLFHRYHITLERGRGQTIWGTLKVFSNGLEVMYDHAYTDTRGRRKTSYMLYQPEVDQQVLSVVRFNDELDEAQQARRRRQIRRSFNPGPIRRMWRKVRNLVNTLRDAFGQAIGAAVGQFQRMHPATALSSQAGQMTQIGQVLVGKFGNAYEPLLEQYIGQPVILDVQDPIDPNNIRRSFTGYLVDYTAHFVAVFNVDHTADEPVELRLPDIEQGAVLPPIPGPPPPGGAAVQLPDPAIREHDLAVRIDGVRLKIQNLRADPVVVRGLRREGFEDLTLGVVIPPSATLDLPARDARGGILVCQVVRCLDIVAPRRAAAVRHAGELVPRRGLADELYLDQLPLVPKILR